MQISIRISEFFDESLEQFVKKTFRSIYGSVKKISDKIMFIVVVWLAASIPTPDSLTS